MLKRTSKIINRISLKKNRDKYEIKTSKTDKCRKIDNKDSV